ncbi:hypothetical protein [Cytobacillus oceanisediminis]|uniref:hypothetical protein n=1 Tax=Cytobacillus oceanisediminis TaxID=665099 RepID=UPI002494B92B|nr:hypothetical protein [Cytobacillus oceanisediminis]
MSPNLASLQTVEAENSERESELSATSDRRSGKQRERVRTRRHFGQKKRKTERESPNLALLRTEEAENRESESELSATSDRRSRKQGE